MLTCIMPFLNLIPLCWRWSMRPCGPHFQQGMWGRHSVTLLAASVLNGTHLFLPPGTVWMYRVPAATAALRCGHTTWNVT